MIQNNNKRLLLVHIWSLKKTQTGVAENIKLYIKLLLGVYIISNIYVVNSQTRNCQPLWTNFVKKNNAVEHWLILTVFFSQPHGAWQFQDWFCKWSSVICFSFFACMTYVCMDNKTLMKKSNIARKLNENLATYRILSRSRSSQRIKNIFWLWYINKKFNKLNFIRNIISIFFISLNSIKKYGGIK